MCVDHQFTIMNSLIVQNGVGMKSNPKLGLIAEIFPQCCGCKSLQHLQLYVLFTLLFAPTVFAQCNPNSAGDFTDTQFDSGANDGVDSNGGWNEDAPYPYIEAGQKIIGDSFRVKGIVGTYDGSGAGNGDTVRDLDWIHFSVAQDCSLTVTLSMADKNGIALNGTDLFDLLFIEQGSDPSTSIDLYGSYGLDGCPHRARDQLADGTYLDSIRLEAGDCLMIVTTPFNGEYGSPPLAYHGPMSYGLDVTIGPAVVFNDLCINPWAGAPNDCVFNAQLVRQFPASIAFDCTQADTDGPNDSANLCGSNTSHDVWYEVGPVPADGDLLISMCGQGNHGDAVLSAYKIPDFTDEWTRDSLQFWFVSCRDDSCDDDGDGVIDVAGPAHIELFSVGAGTRWLVRLGSFLDENNPNALGFAGTLEISFRGILVNNGLAKFAIKSGAITNLGLTSGYVSAANPKRWSLIPFEMAKSGTVDGFNFPAFDVSSPNMIGWKIVHRDSSGGAYGLNGRPFGSSGNFDQSQVVAEGSVAHNFVDDWRSVGDSNNERHFIDIAVPFQLEAGSYYFTCYGEYADGSAGASFAWCVYGSKSMLQQTTTQVVIDTDNAASAPSVGTWPAGTPHGWRGVGAGPKMCFYTLGVNYTTQAGDAPGLLYSCPFNLSGLFDAPCFGDMDNSGEVDSGDVGIVLLDTGPCGGCPTDLDASGEVDSGDVGLVLLSSGPCQ